MSQDTPAGRPGAPHPRRRETEGEKRRAGASGSGGDSTTGPRGSRGACGTQAAGAGHPTVIGTGPWRLSDRQGAPYIKRPPEFWLQAGGTPTPPARPTHSSPRPPPAGALRARGGARGGRDLPVSGAPAWLRPGARAGRRGRLRSPRAALPTRQPGTSASPPPPLRRGRRASVRGLRPAPPHGATLGPPH